MIGILHWFGSWTGINDSSSKWYSFWSGFGSDLSMFGAVAVALHHLNCHVHGCWRLGPHQVEGTPYKVCRKHHPTVPSDGATLEQIHAAHKAAQD